MTAGLIRGCEVARCISIYWDKPVKLTPQQAEDWLYELALFFNIMQGGHPSIPTSLPLHCSRGHHIVSVAMQSDHNWHPYLVPVQALTVDGPAPENGRQVVFNAEEQAWRARTACEAEGCTATFPAWGFHSEHEPGARFCDRHRDRDARDTDELLSGRMNIVCPEPRCRYRGTKYQHKLWALFTMAVATRDTAVRLPD